MQQKRFFIFYWSFVVIILSVYLINDGIQRKEQYFEVRGEVIDQIPVLKPASETRSVYEMMPQVSYPVGDTNYIFVDHSMQYETGETVTILYSKKDPQDAQIYGIRFWIDLGVVVPTFLITAFIFCIILIAMSKDKKKIVLPGELDQFYEKDDL